MKYLRGGGAACLWLALVLAPCQADVFKVSMGYDPTAPGNIRLYGKSRGNFCNNDKCGINEDSPGRYFFEFDRTLTLGSTAWADNYSVKFPPAQTVTLRSGSNTVEVTLSFYGARHYLVSVTSVTPNAFSGTVGNGCSLIATYLPNQTVDSHWYVTAPQAGAQCLVNTSSTRRQPWSFHGYFYPAYRLEMARPANLIPAGIYKGQLQFSAVPTGAGAQDFALGQGAAISLGSAVMEFELEVGYELGVTFPDPATTIALQPAGGGVPEGAEPMYARVPFELNTNGSFRVGYRCGTQAPDQRCALSAPGTATLAPFDIKLDWAGAPNLAPGYPGEGRPTGTGREWGYSVSAGHFNGAFALAMENTRPLYEARGKQWSGFVTFIFDAGL
ncbi:hypothetical protein [Pseudomonas sp. NPDC007930]|uniref:hypothetical protein n=1 Tax=Pseudomonas sp. NPDC007930 TaxID=3364417 RepID=UPI0036E4231C